MLIQYVNCLSLHVHVDFVLTIITYYLGTMYYVEYVVYHISLYKVMQKKSMYNLRKSLEFNLASDFK